MVLPIDDRWMDEAMFVVSQKISFGDIPSEVTISSWPISYDEAVNAVAELSAAQQLRRDDDNVYEVILNAMTTRGDDQESAEIIAARIASNALVPEVFSPVRGSAILTAIAGVASSFLLAGGAAPLLVVLVSVAGVTIVIEIAEPVAAALGDRLARLIAGAPAKAAIEQGDIEALRRELERLRDPEDERPQ